MYKKMVLFLMGFVMLLSFSSCQKEAESAYPQLAPMKKGEDVAIITTNMGVIKLRFFPQYAPKAVENFITHSKNGYYDGVIFHRVVNDFMIQTGDPLGTGMGGESIWGGTFEYEIDPNVRHIRGAVSMAHSSMPDSNGSQFFIVQKPTPVEYVNLIGTEQMVGINDIIENKDLVVGQDENNKDITLGEIYPVPLMESYAKDGGADFLDFGYTVFAQVYEGMDVVDAIAAVEVDDPSSDSPKPINDVVIESIKIEKYQK